MSASKSWSDYWERGSLHSFPAATGTHYSEGILEFWQRISAAIAPDSRILDLATGNGALPYLLLREQLLKVPATIVAVDRASISPPWIGELPAALASSLHFKRGVDIEALPQSDTGYTHVFSQYGIEYANLNKVRQGVQRCLKGPGCFAAIVHSAEGKLAKTASREIADHQLLAKLQLRQTVEDLLPLMAKVKTPSDARELSQNAKAVKIRKQYNTIVHQLVERLNSGEGSDVIVDALNEVKRAIAMAQTQTLAAGRARWRGFVEGGHQALQRIRQLADAAMDQEAVQRFGADMAETLSSQSAPQIEAIYVQQELVGWGVVVTVESQRTTRN